MKQLSRALDETGDADGSSCTEHRAMFVLGLQVLLNKPKAITAQNDR